MKKIKLVLSVLLLLSFNASAAVICVQDKATGRFEVKSGGETRAAKPDECSATALNAAMPSATVPRVAIVSAPAAEASLTVTTVQVPPAPRAGSRTWSLKPEHHSIRDVIEDWATDAGGNGNPAAAIDVIWEARDFPLTIKREKIIATGDFWQALTVIGESYRNSDAAFQVQPTAFQQIVIIPMTKSTQADANK